MKYSKFEDLPRNVQKYLIVLYGVTEAKKEVTSIVPALDNRSILQAYSDGDLSSVKRVLFKWGDIAGVTEESVYQLISTLN